MNGLGMNLYLLSCVLFIALIQEFFETNVSRKKGETDLETTYN